jgi:formylaminopyrimidine deformylase / aminopyrimidine aminohydrolase
VPVADLLARSPAAWRAATRHPFLDGIRAGTLPPEAFGTWLVQDAAFVADLLAFQARLLARAPRPASLVLAQGAVSLVEELAWFDERAAALGLALGAPRLPATQRYAELLDRLDAADPAAALTALWVLERVYLEAWSTAAPGAGGYAPYVEHWTSPGFAGYVAGLERAADALVPDELLPGLEPLVADVLAAETAFWDMAGAVR